MAEDTTYDLIAATGCPTGIAHTYMAKEALEKAAAAKGLTIKVETHGQVGIENEVTPAQIKAAKAVIVAADKDVQAERFAGKPMVSVGVTAAIKDPRGSSTRLWQPRPRASSPMRSQTPRATAPHLRRRSPWVISSTST